MDKLTNFVSTVKDSSVWSESSGASDKFIKCLAVIGLISSARALWPPLKNIIYGGEGEQGELAKSQESQEEAKVSEVQPPTQRAAQLKERYGGQWSLITDNTDPTTRHLAVELAKEGYNLIFIIRKDGIKEAKRIHTSSSKFGGQTEFITAESYFAMTGITEEVLKDKDLAIVVTGLVYDSKHSSKTEKEQQDLLSLSVSQ